MENNEFKWAVFVKCFTFNQATYILDAMNGFTMQQTTFPYVCCIVDDASTDGEPEVIRKYLHDNFDLEDQSVVRNEETDDYTLTFAQHKANMNCYFAVLFLKYNHYKKKAKTPYMAEWRKNSKYEALCEGDDYWTEKFKLQLQVDEMEKRNDIDICAHTAVRIKNNLVHGFIRPIKGNGIIPVERVIADGGGLVATNSLLIRLTAFNEPHAFRKVMGGDHSLQIMGSLRGGLLFIDKEMSVYRVMAANSWSSRVKADKQLALGFYEKQTKMLDVLDEETNGKYKEAIYRRKLTIEFQKAFYLRDWHELKDEKYKFILENLSSRKKIQLFLSHYAPWLSNPTSTMVDIICSSGLLRKALS